MVGVIESVLSVCASVSTLTAELFDVRTSVRHLTSPYDVGQNDLNYAVCVSILGHFHSKCLWILTKSLQKKNSLIKLCFFWWRVKNPFCTRTPVIPTSAWRAMAEQVVCRAPTERLPSGHHSFQHVQCNKLYTLHVVSDLVNFLCFQWLFYL